MGNMRQAARFASAAILFVVMSGMAAAEQLNFTFPTTWSPPPMTVKLPPAFQLPIFLPPTNPSPIHLVPVKPIGYDPYTDPLEVPRVKFPAFPPPSFGPVWNPTAPKPTPTVPVQTPSGPPTTSTAADVAAVVSGNNQFAYDLYGALSGMNSGNTVFSPYSISTALAMTYAGAAGQTATEMAQTLHFTLPQDQLHPAMGQLINQINSQGGKNYQLSVANHLWGQSGFTFLPGFLNTTSSDYQAPLSQLDFIHNFEPARQTINTWTANQTNQKIQDLLPYGSVTSYTRLVLTNAVYFKGDWQSAFDKNSTTQETFLLSSGSLESVPMMHKQGTFKYGAFQNFSMLDMPYKGGDISMLAILPSQSSSLASVEKSLNVQTLNQDEGQLSNTVVKVGLPKSNMTGQFGLKSTLASMGMPSAFGKGADFSGMDGTRDLSISDVIHKAYVNIDETGTEAAGATAVVVGITATAAPVIPLTPAIFDADHPFDFLIRDNKSGSILFMGRVSDPGGTPIVTPLPTDTFFSSPSGTWEIGTMIVGSDLPVSDGTNLYVSDASFLTPVPEPSTLVLLLAGIFGLAAILRRRKLA
jgi:serpin B